jgi:PTS system mannose-specific IID component
VVVLGLVVIGCMIPSTVKITLLPVFVYGEAKQSLQDIVNGIFPYLLPVLATTLIYKVLPKKGITTARLVWIIIAISIVLTYFKVI